MYLVQTGYFKTLRSLFRLWYLLKATIHQAREESMSSFNCEHCGKAIIDTQRGYVTECPHYPLDTPQRKVAGKYYPFIEEDYDGQ